MENACHIHMGVGTYKIEVITYNLTREVDLSKSFSFLLSIIKTRNDFILFLARGNQTHPRGEMVG